MSWEELHAQSRGMPSELTALGCSDYAWWRGRIADWLVDAFEAMQLRDKWLVTSICLLDHLAAARELELGGLGRERAD